VVSGAPPSRSVTSCHKGVGGRYHSRQTNAVASVVFAMPPSSCTTRRTIVHRHGPRTNPCPGSQQPPLGPSVQAAIAMQALSSQPPPVRRVLTSQSHPANGTSGRSSFTPVDCAIVKPQSARATCASHLSGLLNFVVSDPENVGQGTLKSRNWTSRDLKTRRQISPTPITSLDFLPSTEDTLVGGDLNAHSNLWDFELTAEVIW